MRFGIGFSQGFAFAGIEIKTMSAVIYPSQNNVEQRKRKNHEKHGLQQKRLRKQKMPQKTKNASAKQKMPQINWRRRRPSKVLFYRLVFLGIPMIRPVNPMVKLRKKPGDLSEASFNDPTDLHCSFIFKDVALGRTENLRREAWTVKNSGDGTCEERMESQILVKYM